MILAKVLFGSHLYGLDTPSSDTDYKGIFLPSRNELLLNNYPKHYSKSTALPHQKNTNVDVDIEFFSLPYFIELACNGETVAIDMLHSVSSGPDEFHKDQQLISSPIWEELKWLRKKFYCKNMKSYVGYARRQANKYGIKGGRMASVEHILKWIDALPGDHVQSTRISQNDMPVLEHVQWFDEGKGRFYEVCGRKFQETLTLAQLHEGVLKIYESYGERSRAAKENEGVDWKAVSHALRAGYQMHQILVEGDFQYPLPQTEFLRLVKNGSMDFVSEVQPELERLIHQLEYEASESDLPEKVDRNFWNDWLLDVYRRFGY